MGSIQNSAHHVDVDALLHQLQALNTDLERQAVHLDEDPRNRLILEGRRLAALLETPFESTQRFMNAPWSLVAVRCAQGFGFLKDLANARLANTTCTAEGIAAQTGIRYEIIVSLLDNLCAHDVARQVAPGKYVGTLVTQKVNNPVSEASIASHHDVPLPAAIALYKSLREKDERPAWHRGRNTPQTFYEWLDDPANAEDGNTFYRFMQLQFRDIPTWLDDIDFQAEYAKDTSPEEVVFVDVGGGKGEQCELLRRRNPSLVGRVVLEDLPGPLKRVEGVDVEKVPYDWLTEQHIRNSRIYYARQVFHDCSDKVCIAILQNHRPALGKDSVFLIDEKVLPEGEMVSQVMTSALSLYMEALFHGTERTESHWRKLIDEAGFQIKSIRPYTPYGDSIIAVAPK